jgi:hypothetical protein
MAKDGLSAYSASSHCLHRLFIWHLGVVAGPGIWNLRSLGLWSKTLVLLLLKFGRNGLIGNNPQVLSHFSSVTSQQNYQDKFHPGKFIHRVDSDIFRKKNTTCYRQGEVVRIKM